MHGLSTVDTIRRNDLFEKAWGYHSFNLHALAMLAEQYPTASVWDSAMLQRTIDLISNLKYQLKVFYNDYGYSYNPAGIENAYALEVFGGDQHDQRRWVEKQLNLCYDSEENLLINGTPDPATHAARIYELTYLPNIEIELTSEDDSGPIVTDRISR
ncbi:agl cluster protein AglQ [Halalkalicoccus jeotgali B3]|uniref:Agl cluster protein AglQ n=1 Tax=Halalkalicoccus jeotgali (strain DSM 18796 / CECT 7217 / JCM 14584 / KCTC 4019 / B3) TaxID=795797 RepID=D8J753_HALJB|nr:agl cluster protein AglQ [Halalkalicoccus jeotgali B3]ELY34008.1 agl cluster protein AglQ [Halalkalicoccus jeotgali B3]